MNYRSQKQPATAAFSRPRYGWVVLMTLEMLLGLSSAPAQIPISAGNNYSQNFDALATGGESVWSDNVTLPGWYAAAQNVGITDYTAGTGADVTAGLHSFGAADATITNRALGSLVTGTLGALAYGIRFTNDTDQPITNFTVTYTGEQWQRADNSSNALQTLAFSYAVADTAITNADPAGTNYSWNAVTELDFSSPQTNGVSPQASFNGHDATNRQVFSSVPLPNVVVAPGQEIFFRWLDADDLGLDHSLAIDDVSISFAPVPPPAGITLSIRRIGANIVVTWAHSEYYLLEAVGNVQGPYNYLTREEGGYATSPYTNTTSASPHFYQLILFPPGGS